MRPLDDDEDYQQEIGMDQGENQIDQIEEGYDDDHEAFEQ